MPAVGGEPAAASELPARRHVPLLTTLALAASQLARDSVALAAFDGLAAALGPAHPDAPFCHAQLALLHRRRNDAEAATAAATAAMAAVAASSERAERLLRAALSERWAHPPAQMPFSVAPAALITLALTAVDLEAMPLALGTARRLWTLDVSCNRLATLPETIGDLRQLRDLLASGNVLTSLPESLASLPQLHVVSVQLLRGAPFGTLSMPSAAPPQVGSPAAAARRCSRWCGCRRDGEPAHAFHERGHDGRRVAVAV